MGGHEGYEARNEGSDESNETSYEGHEGQESHEGEQDRKGKAGPCSRVPRGKEKTSGGMTKDQLVKSKTGKIVSKKASARAKKSLRDEPAEEVDGGDEAGA